MNCFEAPSDLTLPACQEMVCRFQVCLQRYLADPVIRGANVSYKKPCMNVAQVCRSTLHRNRLLIFDKTTTPISLLSDRSTLFTMLGSRRWCLHLPPAVMFRVCRPSLVRVKQLMGSHIRREQVDGMNCFEAPSGLTLPACQEMVCRFQVCLQRYLADPVIRGANVSYKKPGMHVAQVCRSTLQKRNRIFDDIHQFALQVGKRVASCNV